MAERLAVETWRGVEVGLASGKFIATVGRVDLTASSLATIRKQIDQQLDRVKKRERAVDARIPCVVITVQHKYQEGSGDAYSRSYSEPVFLEGVFAGLDPDEGYLRIEVAGAIRRVERGLPLFRADDPAVPLLRQAAKRWVEAQLVELDAQTAYQTLRKTSGVSSAIGHASKKADRQRLIAQREAELLAYLRGKEA